MELALRVALLVAIVAVGTSLARRVRVPAPLLLVAVGVVASYVPAMPDEEWRWCYKDERLG